MVPASELMLKRGGSVNPSKFPDEVFDLLSIPAFDRGEVDISLGSEIGSSKSVVQPNDVLISKIIPHIRRCWVVPAKGENRQIGSGEWIIFRDDRFLPSFLKHFLTSNIFHSQFMNTVAGIGGSLVRARPAFVEKIEIPLPYPEDLEKSLKEQKRIAAILDKADGIRRKRKQTIQLADEFLLSFFLETFGDPVTNPKGWEIKKIEDVALKVTDGVHFKPNYIETGVPFISVKDITTGKLSFENTKFISLEDHENYIRRCNPEYMDILYTKVGATYGRPAIVDVKKDFSLYVSVCLIKPDHKKINAMFLTEVLATSALKRQADRSIKGAGVPDLHLIEIKKFILPVPSMKVQNDYVKKTRSVHKKIETYKESLRKIDDLFKSLSQKAFNGEL